MKEGVVRLPRKPAHSSAKDWVALAKSIAPLIEADVPIAEEARTLSPRVVDAFKQTELFWMLAPVEVGGGGGGYRDLIRVVEELSYADCSAGWSYMANVEATGAAGAYCGESAIDAMFGGSEKAIIAGQLGSGGKCVQVRGGYQAGGHFSFGSGCAHANWFGGGMLVYDDGKLRQLAHGPEVRICFVPRDKVTQLDNWDVAGLSATGSFDYEIPDQFVPDDFTMERAIPVQLRGGPMFQLGFAPIVGAGHAGVVLGGMRRALHEIARLAGEKKRVGYPGLIGDYPTFQEEFSYNEATYRSARDYVITVYDEAEATVRAGLEVTDYQRARFRQVAAWIHTVGADVIRACYTWSGSEGFRGSTPIGRVFRDMFVATNHLFIDPIHLVQSAPAIIDHYRQGCPDAPGSIAYAARRTE